MNQGAVGAGAGAGVHPVKYVKVHLCLIQIMCLVTVSSIKAMDHLASKLEMSLSDKHPFLLFFDVCFYMSLLKIWTFIRELLKGQ